MLTSEEAYMAAFGGTSADRSIITDRPQSKMTRDDLAAAIARIELPSQWTTSCDESET